MLTENDVIQAVSEYLRSKGYRIDRALSTAERGIDIVAVNGSTEKRLLVEAKGGTSSKAATARFGKPFTLNQARSHVSVALYCAARLRHLYLTERPEIALAFPDDNTHRRLVEEMHSTLQALEIAVFFVDADRQVVRC